MTTNTAYRIENLDVYRKSIALGTRLYQDAGNGRAHSAVGERIRETALSLVLNLASGLGFWEKQWKTSHFAASKRAVMEMSPLLELMVALGEMKPEKEAQYVAELQELAKMIGGLLRQAQRREAADEGGATPEGEARERVRFYH
jgi:four helix bundle protein